MNKEQLANEQKIVYQTLHSSLINKHLSHAYMFEGLNGTGKKGSAYLFAKSIFCENPDDGFACEKCGSCQRVDEGNYADLIYIDGGSESIKKDAIMSLQEQFSKTAMETVGYKVYIIDHCENASSAAMNALLKFVEEANEQQIAIFISDQVTRILPTIISRCQIIPFKPIFNQDSYKNEDNLDILDAYFLHKIVQQKAQVYALSEEDDYQHARYVFEKCVKILIDSPWDCIYFMQSEGFVAKAKTTNRSSVLLFFDLITIFFKDCLKQSDVENTAYQTLLAKMRQKHIDYAQAILLSLNSKDLLVKSVNIPLLLDQYLYQLKEVIR